MVEKENGIGKIIKKARMMNELTVEQLADKVEVSERYIQKIENENKIPSYKTMSKIIKALSLDANQLFYNFEVTDEIQDMDMVIKKIRGCNKYEFNVIKATLLALMEKENSDADV